MINLYDILDAADGQLFGEPVAQIFSGFSFDPRQTQPGSLFAALKTERGDGHHYMQEAVQAGAAGLMCTHPPSFDTQGVTVIVMRDVDAALMRWTKYILEKYRTTVIAVMGSYGKSTTCNAIAQVLSTRYQVYHGQIDFPGRFGIPLALSHLTNDHQLAVLECDPQSVSEMAEIIQAVQPSVGVITNISGEGEDMLHEALTMLRSLPDDGLAVLNFDDPQFARLQQDTHPFSLTVSVDRGGTSFGADLTAYNIVVAVDKTGFDVRYGSDRHVGKWVPLLGTHQIYPVLVAAAVGLAFDIALDDSLAALTHLEPLPGRLRPLAGVNGCLLVDDTARGSSEGLMVALDWLRAVMPQADTRKTMVGQVSPVGKIYVVLGDIDDRLDGYALSKRLTGVASVVVAEGDAIAPVIRNALESGLMLESTHITYSPTDSAATIKDRLAAKDVVLVVGNENAHMERAVAELLDNADDSKLLARQAVDIDLDEHPGLHAWVQVDVNTIARNTHLIKAMLKEDTRLMAVVKANAYGHGAVPVSTTVVLNGADYLGVATPDEALELRESGVNAPILVLGYTPSQAASRLLSRDIAISVYDQNIARVFNRVADSLGTVAKVHIRIDPGTGGMGLMHSDVAVFFRALSRLEAVKIEGVYTVLDISDWTLASRQFSEFQEAVKMLRAAGFSFDIVHAANSAVLLRMPEAQMDMVRCGLLMYGIQPHPSVSMPDGFAPALTWKTSVVQVKRVPGRMVTGEDGIPTTTKTRTVAVLPVGYQDGFRGGTPVLVKEQPVEVIEPIEAYQTLVDVSSLDDVRAGDEVVLIGQQGAEQIRVEDIAAALNIDVDEVVSTIMAQTRQMR